MILFDGGMDIGWRRFRRAVVPIASLGVVGTFTTALVMAGCAHYLLDFDWTTAGILAAALAPTDPAVMFSILGNREIGGRTGTILEGEAGVNDPVGIALMIGMLEFATADDGSLWTIAEEFVLEMGVGLVVGVAGTALLVLFIRRVPLPSEGLYPLRTLAAAGVIYGLASVAGGSGFLAVFIAGLVLGDLDVPFKRQIRRFHMALASLAEIVVFVALGLTVNVSQLFENDVWLDGLRPGSRARFHRAAARSRAAARAAPAPHRREAVHRLERAEGRRPDSARRVRAPGRGRRRAADLRDRLRRRDVLGHRPGSDDPVRRLALRCADAPGDERAGAPAGASRRLPCTTFTSRTARARSRATAGC